MVVTTKKPQRELSLNLFQLALEMAPQRVRMSQLARGAGKSTGAALDIKSITYDMPRSKNFIAQSTFSQALTRTLPSTIEGLEMIGFVRDLHFFVCREPPRSWKWDKAWQAPEDPKRSIYFSNGTVWELLSQDTSSRGGNYAAGITDEVQDMDQKKFESEVLPTMRLKYKMLKDKKTYRRLSLFGSMPRTRKAEWIFKYEELAKTNPKEYLWLSGPSAINSENLPPDWFADQKRLLMPSEYDIEIENIRPKKVIGGFYPFFDDRKHTYVDFNNDYLEGIIDNDNGYNASSFESMSCLQDNDLNFDAPLDISMDYGGWFNGIVTGQESGRDDFNFLSAMSIDSSKKFEDLLNMWCNYYRFHKVKTVHYWYDHTALDRDARSEMYPEIVKRVLRSFGWMVIDEYIGQQPSHDDRYRFFGYVYKNDRPELPRVGINRHHCKYLVISLNGADIRQGRNGFEKEKKDEKNRAIDQRTTTHFSDAHDTLLIGKYAHRTLNQGGASFAAKIMHR